MSRTLVEHPEFPLMVAKTLDRFHCTLAEVREDYWLYRAWKAISHDQALAGHVARLGVSHLLVTGSGYGATPVGRERAHWQRRVRDRIATETAHSTESLGMEVRFADGPIQVAKGCVLSLLAQAIGGDDCWKDLADYADDLAPVIVPVAYSAEAVVAA